MDNLHRCNDCGAVFLGEEAATHIEIHQLDGYQYRERWAACPECRSTDLEDIETCPICRDWSRGGACRRCQEEIHEVLQQAMELSDTKDGQEAILDEIINFVEEYET